MKNWPKNDDDRSNHILYTYISSKQEWLLYESITSQSQANYLSKRSLFSATSINEFQGIKKKQTLSGFVQAMFYSVSYCIINVIYYNRAFRAIDD